MNTSMKRQWFDVDRIGLGLQAEELGKGKLIGELIQNALDEDGVSRIDITLTPITGRPLAELTVEDDSPEGFRNLSHAYTLFAESQKRGNPEQRGQFNLGEKLVIACCEAAKISTTKGTVVFDAEGRSEKRRQKRERGSIFEGRLKLTREELDGVAAYLQRLILPGSIEVTFNGQTILTRRPLKEFPATLPTMIADESGVMQQRNRKTNVAVFEVRSDETASLYEMGLPIVETGDKWHINIGQKVPLNRDRNNVTPTYLKALRTQVVNQMIDGLGDTDANQTWVRQATSDPDCSREAITKVLDLRFGEKRAAFDPHDPESNKTFVSQGGVIVYGGMLNPQEWHNAKRAGAIQPASKFCPTPKPYSDDPNAPRAEIIPESKWSEGMSRVAQYAKYLARELMNVKIDILMVRAGDNFLAAYCKRGAGAELHFNVPVLGPHWFDDLSAVDPLLIHEFGHQYSGDHLSEEYYDALCNLGARFKQLALEKPDEIRGLM